VQQRQQWEQARVEVFGHALLEKLVQPYVAITGHAWRVGPTPVTAAPLVEPRAPAIPIPTQTQTQIHSPAYAALYADVQLDAWLCDSLQEDLLRRKAFAPLPVLGVPGWWVPNETEGFYAQTHVFRKPRTPDTDKSN
jgi:hypothetical protein